jgi:hypothetical protein
MPLTGSIVDIADYCLAQLSDSDWMTANSVQQVLYGDQNKIGLTPLICVEPSEKARELVGVPRRTQVDMDVHVLVYYGKIQDVQLNRREGDLLPEAVEARLHEDPTCGGLVTNSMVSRLVSGFANKSGTLIRTTRLTFSVQSRVQLPMAGV